MIHIAQQRAGPAPSDSGVRGIDHQQNRVRRTEKCAAFFTHSLVHRKEKQFVRKIHRVKLFQNAKRFTSQSTEAFDAATFYLS